VHGRISPDGRLLALLAPHPLVVGADGLVQGVDRDRQGAMLYLLEISTRRVIFSIDAAGPTETMLEQWGGERPSLLAWSPDSRRLVFYDASQQVVLVDVETQQLTLITLSGGQTLGAAGWSFDGGYLSLTRPAGRSSETGEILPGRTFVLVAP
jgi:Tol biopolymer transport system component